MKFVEDHQRLPVTHISQESFHAHGYSELILLYTINIFHNTCSCLLLAFLSPTTCHFSILRSINLILSLYPLALRFLLSSFVGAFCRPPWPFLDKIQPKNSLLYLQLLYNATVSNTAVNFSPSGHQRPFSPKSFQFLLHLLTKRIYRRTAHSSRLTHFFSLCILVSWIY